MPTATVFAVQLGGGADGELIRFEIGEECDACRLRASYRDQVIDLMGTDFFTALCQVRDIMALSGMHPICYGASLDVYCLDWMKKTGKGLLAHRLTMGEQPGDADIVEIFDYGPDVCPSTVVEQRKHYQYWRDSTRG